MHPPLIFDNDPKHCKTFLKRLFYTTSLQTGNLTVAMFPGLESVYKLDVLTPSPNPSPQGRGVFTTLSLEGRGQG